MARWSIIGIGRLDAAAQDVLMQTLRAPAFRLIATAGLGIEEKIAQAAFAAICLICCNRHEIVVPPLADRPDDAVWLATRLFPGFNARRGAPLAGTRRHGGGRHPRA